MSVLIFMLSQQLRARELVAMKKIGAGKGFVVTMVTCEIVMVLVSGVMLGMILTLLSEKYGLVLLQSIIVSGV
jgi:predicted lysophospholipase L1 biosynthesis ABC-type transport system permease subunit